MVSSTLPYDPTNVFAKILRHELPYNTVYEDDSVLAIEEIAPSAPFHVLLLPKGAYGSLQHFILEAPAGMQLALWRAVATIAAGHALDEKGYRLIINHGADGGQTIPHMHVHMIGGVKLGQLVRV